MDRSTELLDCTPTSLDAATKIMDFLHTSIPKTEVLNQVTESLDSATEEMNGATGEPDQGAKIMDASAKELEPTAENLDIDGRPPNQCRVSWIISVGEGSRILHGDF